ncbi:MAG: EamA family transporter [Deltaproteobacteria bacterium]|nr:MAG: EamA family transporter [Deltaproteobacteria bacterium]
MMSASTRQMFGWFAVFGSTFCFYLATLIIRWADDYVAISTSFFVFSRFLLGFIVVCCTMAWKGQPLRPRRYHYLAGRTVFNTIAVFCFFKAVEKTSVAEANILNMTYPLFVTIFSWFLIPQQRDKIAIVLVCAAFAGVWLVLAPGAEQAAGFCRNDIWGICSGFTAGFAILYLNISRQYHDSQTILFFMFGLGALLMLLIFWQDIFVPNGKEFFFLAACAASGVLGQYLLTYGFFFVTAVEGSVISSSRILLAALLGPLLAAEPSLTLSGWLGAFFIFSANVGLAVRRAQK